MEPPSPQPTNVRWGVFAVAFGTSWMLYLHRYTFALIKPQIAEDWQLDKTQLGLLDSAFSIPYTLFQVPLAMATDTWGVRYVLTGMILLWTLGLAMHAWAASPAQLWYGRVFLGAGQSAGYAALARVSRQWFPLSIRTSLQGIVNVSAGRIGGLSANLLFSSVLLGVCGFDWRSAIYVFVVLGLVQAILTFAVIRNSPREHPLVNAAEAELIAGPIDASQPAAPSMSIGQMLRRLDVRGVLNLAALIVQTIFSSIADNIYSNWIPLFLSEVHGMKAGEMGIFSALPLLGGALGGVLGGVLNDRCLQWTGNRRWSRSGVAIAGKTIAAVLLFVALAAYDLPYVFCTLLFFVKLFGDWSLTTMVGVVTDIGGQATASVYAFNNAVASIGMILAPILFGALAQHYGWPVVFVTVAITYLLCSLSWLVIDCTIPLVRATESAAGR